MKIDVTVRFPTAPPPEQPPPPLRRYVGWRCLHSAEGGYPSDPRGMPEIRPALPNPLSVGFTKELQELSWLMNRHNPLFTKSNWRAVYGNHTAFTNGQGFDKNGDPRADWVNIRDISKPLPRLMKALICGGMFIRGVAVGGMLECYPGIHAIDASRSAPSVEEVFANNWYFVATTQKYGKVSNFPQGHGQHVYIPYVLRETVTYPIEWFVKWDEAYLPDPLKIYLTN